MKRNISPTIIEKLNSVSVNPCVVFHLVCDTYPFDPALM